MIEQVQRRMIAHAALVLLIGMLAGIGLLVSLIGGLELVPGHILAIGGAGDPAPWVRAHVGGMLNALLLIAVALVIPPLHFDSRAARRLAWIFIGTAWANTLFYWAALLAPNRALTFGDNRFGPSTLVAVIGLAPALLFVVISLVGTVMLARRAFAKP